MGALACIAGRASRSEESDLSLIHISPIGAVSMGAPACRAGRASRSEDSDLSLIYISYRSYLNGRTSVYSRPRESIRRF